MGEIGGVEAYEDLVVAAVAAACAVLLTLALEFGLGVEASVLVRLGPLYVYFVYLFVRNTGLPSPENPVSVWSATVVAVTLATLTYYAL